MLFRSLELLLYSYSRIYSRSWEEDGSCLQMLKWQQHFISVTPACPSCFNSVQKAAGLCAVVSCALYYVPLCNCHMQLTRLQFTLPPSQRIINVNGQSVAFVSIISTNIAKIKRPTYITLAMFNHDTLNFRELKISKER